MSGFGVVAAFWLFALLSVGSALMIIASRNLLHAVLFLILSFIGVAGLFLTLSADFIAVAQVLVYAGAIGVLVIFAIMLTPQGTRDNSNSALFLPSALLALLIFGIIAVAIFNTDWPQTARSGFAATAAVIGATILNQYALPFEIVSVVLLAAMIGAIVLVREQLPSRPSQAGMDPAPAVYDGSDETVSLAIPLQRAQPGRGSRGRRATR
ncbi:MAG: NADH-quinone oxidoreductase subunit J family protein [Dehalococcoidia bacterium]